MPPHILACVFVPLHCETLDDGTAEGEIFSLAVSRLRHSEAWKHHQPIWESRNPVEVYTVQGSKLLTEIPMSQPSKQAKLELWGRMYVRMYVCPACMSV